MTVRLPFTRLMPREFVSPGSVFGPLLLGYFDG